MNIKNDILRGLDGEPILERNERDETSGTSAMTVAKALRLMSLGVPGPGEKPYTPDQSVGRLLAAIECHKALVGAEFQIDDVAAQTLRNETTRYFGPIIAGQLTLILDGKASPILATDQVTA